LYKVHALGHLYAYFSRLFFEHSAFLERNTNTDWSLPLQLDKWISDIEDYDSSSTYFRYPITKCKGDNKDKDLQKSAMKEDNYLSIMSRMGSGQKPVKAFFIMNEDDEVTQAFFHDDGAAISIMNTLKETCQVFHDCHAALRGELTNGW
jgi:hypothetical protein